MSEKQETVETLNSRTVDWIFSLKQDRERLVLAGDLIQDCLRLLRAQQKRIAELESLLSDAKESNLQRQVRLAQESSKHRPWWLQVHGR